FTCMHWVEARLGFILSIVGSVVMVWSAMSIPEVHARLEAQWHPTAATAQSARDLSREIQEHRDQMEALQATFAQEAADLGKEYQALEAQRKALKPGDTAAILKFNEAAAGYQARNARHKQVPEQIAKTQQELTALLDTRARDQATAAAN